VAGAVHEHRLLRPRHPREQPVDVGLVARVCGRADVGKRWSMRRILHVRGRRARRSALVVGALLTLLPVAAGCGGSSGSNGSSGNVTVQKIASQPKTYYGDQVTIETTVSKKIDHRVWEMADGKLFVIYDPGMTHAPIPGDRLRVEGTVRPLEKSTIEGRLNVNIENHFFSDQFLSDDATIVASNVTRVG